VFSNGIAPRASDLYCIITGVGIPVGTYITNIESLSSTYSGTISVTISNATTASGSSITLDPSQFEIPLSSKQIVSNSEWFEYDVLAAVSGITKTGISELSQFPDRYWLNPGQMTQAPIFAHLTSTEEEIDVTSLVSNIEMVYYPSPDSINFPAPPPPPTPTPPPVPAPNTGNSLYAINQLTINQSLTSPNGRYFAIMQGDGNFVVYDKTPNSVITVPSQTLSYSGTDSNVPNYGSTGENVKILQNDLNLIAGAGLAVDGLYGVRTRQAVTDFQTFFKIKPIDGICGPQTWGVISYLLNLKSPQGNKAIWSTKTDRSGANRAVVQEDGNFVLYTPANKAVWASGSKGQSVVLTMQNDSNLVLYETSGANKWQWFGFPYAVWSWWTGSIAENPGYNAFLATTNKPPPTLPPVQPPPPPVIVYGEWVEIGKSDSADNFPNGMYPADVNHYLTYNLHYTGSQSSLQNLTELNLNSVASIPAASNIVPGISSLMTSNGVVHVFGYTGVDTVNKKLTGCSFDGKITDVLLNNATVTIFGNYNFEWSSQKEYTDYIVNMVKKLNGQFDNSTNPTKYRLPVSGAFWNKQDPEEVVPLSKILAPLSAQVVSTVYGGI
jgi:peptidoglycan hydrolase-like protein with peptidoglycan-binding domain